ncbi:sodium:solute symporter [Sporosarcina sp. HYO08]|uniref:sodium:solute symporter family protein n=1 Tax=Sporosarcina sp. HYO08 TaxID=1759557 RepID=UPI00079765DA|nr:sodium:solute symporter family protein [Sporosarcina sp. HYO08]KXH83794.1 hypothetical protein AU377_03240 [Sporosarcina sp. HYO08]
MNTILPVIIIAVFILINAIVIRLFHRKQNSFEEYAVGSRSFPWFLSMFGFLGSWYIGSVYTGWFGDSATIGVFAQYLAIYSVGTMITMFIMIRPVWIWGKNHSLETNGDLAALRYNSKSFGLFLGLTTFLFWTPWLVIELKTLGYLVFAATNGVIPFNLGLIIVGLFVVIYSWLGGVRAGVIGDLVQGLFFTIIGSATIIFLFYKVYGGIIPMFDNLVEKSPELLIIPENIGPWIWSSAIITGAFGGMMNPGIFNRLYMAKSVRAAKKSALVAPLIGSMFTILILWLGLGATLLEGFPKDAQSGAFWIAAKVGPIGLGLMGVFALAASMSSITACVSTSAAIIGKNLTGKISREKKLKYAKLSALLLGLISIAIATVDIPRLVAVIIYVYECIAQAAVPLILGLYWKRGNKYGAYVGTVIGMGIVILNGLFPWLTSWANGVSAGLIGLMFNLIFYIVVSLVTPRQSNVDQLFEELESPNRRNVSTSIEAGEVEINA